MYSSSRIFRKFQVCLGRSRGSMDVPWCLRRFQTHFKGCHWVSCAFLGVLWAFSWVSGDLEAFQECSRGFREVSGTILGVSGGFSGSQWRLVGIPGFRRILGILGVFHGAARGISGVTKGSFSEFIGPSKGCFKDFQGVSRLFHRISEVLQENRRGF